MKKLILFTILLLAPYSCFLTVEEGVSKNVKINEFSFILKPSPGLGVGIFSTHEIPIGTTIVFYDENYHHRRMHKNEIPPEFLKYCVAESDDIWLCPQRFDRMEIAWYLNHSNSPNIKRIKPGTCVVVRRIKKGEEITINYNDLDEPEHLKEEYYKDQMGMMMDVEIKKSEIGQFEDGLGAFAVRDFKKGEIVIKWRLQILTESEYKGLSDYERENFCHKRDGKIYLYPDPERHVNRSQHPNVYPDFKKEANIALRDIAKGEELSIASSTIEDF